MHGFVFYPDGGCRPQHEYNGAGIHGYRWNLSQTARGIGHNSHSASMRGYAAKAETHDFENKEAKAAIVDLNREQFQQWVMMETDSRPNIDFRVPVECYYDAFIPLDFGGTNNTAELLAAVHCFERLIHQPGISEAALVMIRQDSRYVVDGCNTYLEKWKENNFTRRDGTMVKNSDIWLRLDVAISTIRDLGVMVMFEWVEAHSTCIGNNSADDLATAGVFLSKNPRDVERTDTTYRISEASDYWASRAENRNPLLNLRYAYVGIAEAEEGNRKEYYLSSQGKLAELTGKRTSDDGFAVVRCKLLETVEDIIQKQVSLPREIDYKFQIDLDNIYGIGGRYLALYGSDFLHRPLSHKRHLQTYGKVLVTTELHPPYLVDRVFDNMDILSDLLDNYKTPDQPTLVTTEITDMLYDTSVEVVKGKKGEENTTKLVCLLKPEITVGYSKHPVTARWKESPTEVKDCDLTLRLGVDLPDRNTLRRLEGLSPKVYLITNTLGPGSFMYAVIIEAGEDLGIWSGMNSSIRVTAKSAKKLAAELALVASAKEVCAGTMTEKVVTPAMLAKAA